MFIRPFRRLVQVQQQTYSTTPNHFLAKPQSLIPLKVLDPHGIPLSTAPDLGQMSEPKFATRVYDLMVGLPMIDSIMNNLQRHGRISFYMTSFGEEAAIVGSSAAWADHDEVFAQYREQGVLLWRGCNLDYLMAQCFSSHEDKSSAGRQMPVHHSSKAHHFFSISSPLATQIPQAAGAAYSLKRSRQTSEAREKDCVICYSGEGAASEGDFHAGVNLASVLGGPMVFFIRNNGFAISTPSKQQFKGDGIASRALGYGMKAIRVDGNDPVAVYLASREARRLATEGEGEAVMVEAMTYRVGHHSTSDDSSAYRNPTEVEEWRKRDNPIHRMRRYLEHRGWWDSEKETELVSRWKQDISRAVKKAEKDEKPPMSKMWTDTFASEEPHLVEQRAESEAIRKRWEAYLPYRTEADRYKSES
ncbi:hypothetical protein CROQUDRAFT_656650 [Cronartium quercuum f. sp. fusiforme G11]|uniref:2-oxoisovalerate dehydrogenase subunit alpha n=1 Tax=Cronartium quercuum f. sp. fusiforme G11 TaxID=708437 RepID=A0A9P6NHC3_9BASI|nr:hypothetical protein CROQUDRAFT_656650 [Cronartium quercuum f. sp. fusiforme G11]